jgi:hypothetical protein
MSDYRRGFGLDIGFTDHLYAQLGTTNNCSAIANLHILQINRGHAKYFPTFHDFTSHSRITASNSRSFSAFVLKSSLNGGSVPTVSFLYKSSIGQSQSQSQIYFTTVGLPPIRSSYNCCSAAPAQSFSGPSPAGLMTMFHCLRFETPTTCRTKSLYLYLPGTGCQLYPQAQVSFFIASCDSQGYGARIQTRLQTGY